MRRRAFIAAVSGAAALMGIAAISVAPAADPGSCRSLKQDTARLRCYDAATAPPPASASQQSSYKRVDIVDLRVDYKALRGSRVEVVGQANMFMGRPWAVGRSRSMFQSKKHREMIKRRSSGIAVGGSAR